MLFILDDPPNVQLWLTVLARAENWDYGKFDAWFNVYTLNKVLRSLDGRFVQFVGRMDH